MQKIFLLVGSLLVFTICLQAQNRQSTNEGRALLLDFHYGAAVPGGDLKDRFGHNFDAGAGIEWMLNDANWILGVGGGILFGNKLKEDVLANIRTPEGQIISSNGSWAQIVLRERGFHVEGRIGKLIPLMKDNHRSGLRLVLGIGFLQHKIRVQDDPQAFVPQIAGAYRKGYDRLTNGWMLSQFVGYQHLAKNRLINFYAGFEFKQAFTRNRRDWDFLSEAASDKNLRKDLMWGLKVGWILPFYISKAYAENIQY
ncbi:MAG TPA: hypothetical protein ENJ45_02405 [Phaeodactylibacter sp.]|nr:hypothetical protein [Phaeodactylibacter sp.]